MTTEPHSQQKLNSTDRTSRTLVVVVLGLIIALIAAFLILRPRPAGSKAPDNPVKSSLPFPTAAPASIHSAAASAPAA